MVADKDEQEAQDVIDKPEEDWTKGNFSLTLTSYVLLEEEGGRPTADDCDDNDRADALEDARGCGSSRTSDLNRAITLLIEAGLRESIASTFPESSFGRLEAISSHTPIFWSVVDLVDGIQEHVCWYKRRSCGANGGYNKSSICDADARGWFSRSNRIANSFLTRTSSSTFDTRLKSRSQKCSSMGVLISGFCEQSNQNTNCKKMLETSRAYLNLSSGIWHFSTRHNEPIREEMAIEFNFYCALE